MTYEELLCYKHCPISLDINYRKIPVTNLGMTEPAAHTFNEIFDFIRNLGLPKLVRTKSGGISKSSKNYICAGWDITVSKICIELVIVYHNMWRFQFRHRCDDIDDNSKDIYGSQAFTIFKKRCEKEGIDLESYAIDNGEEVKKDIEKYMIWAEPRYIDLTIDGVHHIDFHNSFPGGLCNCYPEFRPVVEEFYEGRKQHKEYKAVLNLTIGFFQSVSCCKARWAHLSRDAIADNNKRVRELSKRLVDSGRIIIAHNTDGIWYKGEIYHGEGEGKKLGQWENDHVNCRIRFKSKGAYEFIENDIYYPVIRGRTNLDKVKPRSQWQWGDIYNKDAVIIEFYFDPEKGITNKEGELL